MWKSTALFLDALNVSNEYFFYNTFLRPYFLHLKQILLDYPVNTYSKIKLIFYLHFDNKLIPNVTNGMYLVFGMQHALQSINW